jgi:hypothetical protein
MWFGGVKATLVVVLRSASYIVGCSPAGCGDFSSIDGCSRALRHLKLRGMG